jgi:hypothetical protein
MRLLIQLIILNDIRLFYKYSDHLVELMRKEVN